jgi:HEPN domain-containing protein
MPGPDASIEVLREWLAKAENDLKNAAHTLVLGVESPTDTVCFHGQQCVEKYLKTLLTSIGQSFPKTHNIRERMKLVQRKSRPGLDEDLQDLLTDYAATIRYPDAGVEISVKEARRSVTIARRVRRLLPKATLRRRKR